MQPEPIAATILEMRPAVKPARGPRWRLALALVGAVCLLGALGFWATREGSAVTPDSVQYLSTAHHVARGDGVRTSVTELTLDAADIPFAPWPPLFPSILGGLLALGVPLGEAARWVNLFFLAATVFPLAWVAWLAGGSRAAITVTVLHALLFYPVMISAFVWSEPGYIFFSLASLGFVGRGLRRERGAPWEFAVGGLLAAAAMLTRYIGFTLIGATGLGLWLLSLHKKPARFWRDLALYALPAALPNAYWLWRNKHLTGHFFGEDRPEAWFPWDRILGDTLRTLGVDWIAPVMRADLPGGGLLAAAGLAGALMLAGIAVVRLRHLRFPSVDEGSGFTYLLWVYGTAFVLAMILLSRRVGFDPINTRYLSPVYPVLLVLAVTGFRFLMRNDRRRGASHRPANLAVTALILLATPQLASSVILADRAGIEERTLTRPYWTSTLWDDASWARDPGLARLVALAGPERPVLSNFWDFVGIRTGLATKPLPQTFEPTYPERLWDFPGALVAVHDGTRRYRATTADLRVLATETGRMRYLETVGDWSFFRVTPESEPPFPRPRVTAEREPPFPPTASPGETP